MEPPLATRSALLGELLDSRYEIRALLGRGGMGEVYEAVDHQLDRTVAVKVLRPELAADRRFLTRFRREAKTSARLSHPGIVAIHDIGDAGELTFIVMEFVAGRTLASIASDGPMDAGEAARIGARVADALAHAHGRGVVHRDISPGNVMVTAGGDVKVLDFGIARASRGSGQAGSPAARGTIAYVAPEQVRGATTDQRADIYALGAVLFELVTGRQPFSAPATEALAHHVATGPAPSPRSLRPEVPDAFDAVVTRCLATEPARRFVHAEALASALGGIANDAALERRGRAHPDTERAGPTRVSATAVLVHPTTTLLPAAAEPLPGVTIFPPGKRRTPGRIATWAAVTIAVLGAGWVTISALTATSNPVRANVHGPKRVPAPSGLSARTSCDGFMATGTTLAWVPGGSSRGYEVWRRGPGQDRYELVTTIEDPGVTAFRDIDLAVDTTYRYVVRAVIGRRVSPPTDEVVARTPLLCLT